MMGDTETKGSLHLGAGTDSLRAEIPPWISSPSSCTISWTLPHKKIGSDFRLSLGEESSTLPQK